MKNYATLSFVAAFAVSASLLFYACSKQADQTFATRVVISDNIGIPNGINYCGTPAELALTAGQSINAGNLIIGNDAANYYFTYSTIMGWKLEEVHLRIDCKTGSDCPQLSNKELAPGSFPYQQIFNRDPGTDFSLLQDTYTFTIPKSALGTCTCFCIYAHAVVVRDDGSAGGETQTAWGGEYINPDKGKWYGVASYCYQECQPLENPGFNSYRQGDWAEDANGYNAGTYLDEKFSICFPSGLTIGCPGGGYSLTLTSPQAIRDFLPQAAAIRALDNNYYNPAGDFSALWGELVAARLNVNFDQCDPGFDSSNCQLADNIFTYGPFAGKTVWKEVKIA